MNGGGLGVDRERPTGLAAEELRARAEALGSRLAGAFTNLVGTLNGAPLGPRQFADRMGMTVGTASRFLRSIEELQPIDVVQAIPGPGPLRELLRGAESAGLAPGLRAEAEEAVRAFEELIEQLGGSRSTLASALAEWQVAGRERFVNRRRQAAFQALAELRGVSMSTMLACYAFAPGEEDGLLDLMVMQGFLGLVRSRPGSRVSFGMRRQSAPGSDPAGAPVFRNLAGEPVLDTLNAARLDGFSSGRHAPIETTQVGDEVQHSLGPTALGVGAAVDLVLAEVVRGAARRRGEGYLDAPLSVFQVPVTPVRRLCIDLLLRDDAVPQGGAERLVYTTIPQGPAVVGDPDRAFELEDIPEGLQMGGGFLGLQLEGFPRYVPALEHAFDALGWDQRRFRHWRLSVPFAPLGSQFSILLGRSR